jgi:hypothetical protein
MEQYNEHVRAYYDLPISDWGKFEGQRQAVRAAYEKSLDGSCDNFGDVNILGCYCEVCFNEYPNTIYIKEDGYGFVTEIDVDEYLAAQHEYDMYDENECFSMD